MKIDRKQAFKLWEKQFGKSETAKDYASVQISLKDYNNRKVSTGWNVHHIKPLCEGGSGAKSNLTIVSIITHEKINKSAEKH